MLVHCLVTVPPAWNSLVPIHTPRGREAVRRRVMWLSHGKNTVKCPQPGLKPEPLDPQSSALTFRALHLPYICGKCSDLMVSVLDSWASILGSSPGQGHCVVFLGKTLYSHSAFLHPGVWMGTCKFNAGG